MLLEAGAATIRIDEDAYARALHQPVLPLEPEALCTYLLQLPSAALPRIPTESEDHDEQNQLRLEYSLALNPTIQPPDIAEVDTRVHTVRNLWGMEVVFDCEPCVDINAGLLATFVNARRHALRQNQMVRLENTQGAMAELLTRTGLHKLFPESCP